MAKEKKVDRRIQRTRALLRDALMRLITKEGEDAKRYDEITVQDITDEANVARTTFYLHFGDKDELLFTTMRDIYEELYEATHDNFNNSFLSDDEADCIATDFEHVKEYGDFYKIMIGKRGSAAFLAQVREYLAESIMEMTIKELVPPDHPTNLPADMMGYAIAGAQIGIIKWWLDNGMQESPQKVAFMMQQLMKYGLVWGLNVSPDQIQTGA
ncbi:MAG: TetR/AcrR family transcriptional regulator [Chloroflexota bacterium]